ncbi:MAG: hypothetical protein M3Q50_05510 [Chloroflexota bacterium]|nr:hypothetical protein [Chloroflexota bacterium]
MFRALLLGAVAGAAGNVALEVVTYGDMLVRGRGASDVPAKMAGALADALGIDPLLTRKTGKTAENRRGATGALLGYGLGVGLGGVYGLLRPVLGRAPTPLTGLAVGLVAMTVSDASYALTGASDPTTWTTTDWLADLVPHVIYGLVTIATYELVSR